MILQLDDQKGVFKESATFDHPYPTTKVRVNMICAHRGVDARAQEFDVAVLMVKLEMPAN